MLSHTTIYHPGVLISSVLRGSTWAYTTLAAHLVLVVLSELASSPVGLISDAAIMAASTGVRVLQCLDNKQLED